MRHVLACKRDRLAGLRITTLSRRPEMQAEAAETADLDALALGERIAHDLQYLLHRQLDVLRRQVALLRGDELDELRLRHAALAVHLRLSPQSIASLGARLAAAGPGPPPSPHRILLAGD